MKKVIFLLFICTMFSTFTSNAQDLLVESRLSEKYDNVSYNPEGEGWYLVSYHSGTQNLMGFCDKEGKLVCPNVVKTEKHKSWINLQVLNVEKKIIHDRWEDDMRIYERDLDYYNKVEAQYDAALKNYNNQVAAAKQEAERRWQNARDQAERYARANARTSTSGGIFGAIAQGVANAAAITAAINSVKYQPFEDQVISERGLYSAPVKPHNPKPTKPVEPATGYEWKPFTYIQPCPFDTIQYASIKNDNGRAIAIKGGKYGVIDSNLETLIDFNYSNMKDKGVCYECCKNDLWGIVMPDGTEKFPCMFTAVNLTKENNRQILLTNIKGKCGAADFETAAPLVPNMYNQVSLVWLTNKEYGFRVKKDNLYGVFDANGKKILDTLFPEINFRHLTDSKNFYIFVNDKQNKGIYDLEGNELVPFDRCTNYEFIQNAFIKMETASGVLGVVGLDGAPVADLAYSRISWNDILKAFVVTQYDKMGVISAAGEELFPLIQCEYLEPQSDYFVFKNGVKDKSYGAVDYNGNVILEPKYAYDKIYKNVEKARKKQTDIFSIYSKASAKLKENYKIAANKFIPK